MNDEERLRKLLQEDSADPEAVEELLPFMLTMREQRISHQATPELLQVLLTESQPRWQQHLERIRSLIRGQMRIVRAEIWLVSALLMALGVIVSRPENGFAMLAVFAPLIAVGSVAFIYDDNTAMMLELESSTGTSLRLLLLTRLLLIFSFDLLLALMGSAFLALIYPQVTLMPMILTWFAPMTFLSALAFLLSVLVVDTLVAMTIGQFIWVMHLLLRESPEPLAQWFALPGFSAPYWQLPLMGCALLMVIAALWIAGSDTHQERIAS